MRALALLASAVLLVGCGILPRPSDPLGALDAWPPSATIAEDGTVITATYEDWPLDGGPRAFACSRAPARVFGAPPGRELVIATDPACVAFDVHQDGHQLRLRLDRAGLPAAFDGLETWTVILAVEFNEATWEASTTLPVVFPHFDRVPGPSAARAG
jgi:hypothetical protein